MAPRLKERYQKVFFFDDSDGADGVHFELIDHVDAYYKRQLLRDTSNYLRPMYGLHLFSDYYHRKFCVEDEREVVRAPLHDPLQLRKLRVAWNLGMGFYGPLLRSLPEDEFARRDNAIQARFDYRVYRKTIGYQRRLFLSLIKARPQFRTELVDKWAYTEETRSIKAVLSSFGYGEICHRDFEAFVAGAVLIKPSMEHIETWPDLYLAGETYLEVDWDGINLIEVCDWVLSNEPLGTDIAANAFEAYRHSLANVNSRIEELVEHFLQVQD